MENLFSNLGIGGLLGVLLIGALLFFAPIGIWLNVAKSRSELVKQTDILKEIMNDRK